ncbi:MAG TPA: ribonuclease HII [Bryobacteraceae bacterium]|nr:ribonuclease HII [Bryobacteraceae bacterium]
MVSANAQAKLRCEGTLERELRARGFRAIAGVDEVGRGSLFGAVFAAAVILSPERPIRGLNDSKQLEPERREVLAGRIRERAVAWSIAAVDAAAIDRINIYQASRVAMKMAVERLSPPADFLLIDAVPLELAIPQQPLIHGDARCHAIAAASILAKVERDACMRVWDEIYPQYGLANHKGYNTPEHLRALEQHGPTPLHRLSFEPVRARSLFPVDFDGQLELFAAESTACG